MRVQSGSASPMHAKPRHAAVGKDVEAQVRETLFPAFLRGSANVFFVSPVSSARSRIGCHTTSAAVGSAPAGSPQPSIQQCDG